MYLFHNGEMQIAYAHNIKPLGAKPESKTGRQYWKVEPEGNSITTHCGKLLVDKKALTFLPELEGLPKVEIY